MSTSELLALLIPIAFGGIQPQDLEQEGAALDGFLADLEALRQTLMTDSDELIPSSDRIRLVPVSGDIKKPYFVALAAARGYTIRIDDYILDDPWCYFTAGISLAGDYLAQENTIRPWIWEVVVMAVPVAIPAPDLETLLNDLKPAHVLLNFTYL
jgi:hypothetical protein